MQEFLDYTNELLNNLLLDFTMGTTSLIGPAKIIAGIGALIGVFVIYKKSVTENEPINMGEIFRMGGLLLGILFYGTFITLLNKPLDLMSKSVKTLAITEDNNTESFFNSYNNDTQDDFSANDEYDNEINDLLNEAQDEIGVDLSEETSSLSASVFDLFTPGNIVQNMQLYIAEAIYNFIHFLGVVAIIVLNIVRTFFLITLTFFGIFVLAISMYPGLQGSFMQWVQKYINVYMWLPVSYILQGVVSKLFTYFKTYNVISVDGVEAMASNWILGLVGLCSVVGFATVPTMSSWLVNATTSGLASKTKQKTMSASKGVASVAKAKSTGGASVAASAAGSAAGKLGK